MQLTQRFAEIFNSMVPDPTPLAKGETVEEMNVVDVTEPEEYGDNAPKFLQGKHYCIVTGERNGETIVRSVLAERMKVAWEAAGIVPTVKQTVTGTGANKKTVETIEVPDCTFAAEGYNQVWGAK